MRPWPHLRTPRPRPIRGADPQFWS